MKNLVVQSFRQRPDGRRETVVYLNLAATDLALAQEKAMDLVKGIAADGVSILVGEHEIWRWPELMPNSLD